MSRETNRMRMQMEHQLRAINREVLNPQIPELDVKSLEPVMRMVACTRGAYLKAFFDLAGRIGYGNIPTDEDRRHLAMLRQTYEELVAGSHALETAIDRGYVDIRDS